MYIPKIHQIEEQEEIFRFIRENPFATIVSEHNGEILATHMLVELEQNEEGKSFLTSHMAKANSQWESFIHGKEILVIFSGPHTYISSSWYDHINVPTWNYIAVHVYGKAMRLDENKTIDLLTKLVDRYEQNSTNPFTMKQLTPQYLKSHLNALVAFTVSIDRVDAKEKLSQNRNVKNLERIITELEGKEEIHAQQIATEMKKVITKKVKNTTLHHEK